MPKINYYKDATADIIKGAAKKNGMHLKDLADHAGIKRDRFFRRMKSPGEITLEEFRAIDRVLFFTDEELLQIGRARAGR